MACTCRLRAAAPAHEGSESPRVAGGNAERGGQNSGDSARHGAARSAITLTLSAIDHGIRDELAELLIAAGVVPVRVGCENGTDDDAFPRCSLDHLGGLHRVDSRGLLGQLVDHCGIRAARIGPGNRCGDKCEAVTQRGSASTPQAHRGRQSCPPARGREPRALRSVSLAPVRALRGPGTRGGGGRGAVAATLCNSQLCPQARPMAAAGARHPSA